MNAQSVFMAPDSSPSGAMLVPNALRERLLKYAGIAEKSHALSVVGTAARLEKGRIAAMLAEKLFGEKIVDEDEALRRVGFSANYFLVWLRLEEPAPPKRSGVGEEVAA